MFKLNIGFSSISFSEPLSFKTHEPYEFDNLLTTIVINFLFYVFYLIIVCINKVSQFVKKIL